MRAALLRGSLGLAAPGLLAGLWPGVAIAERKLGDDVESLTARITELDANVRALDVRITPVSAGPEAAERRLIDGQVLYELKSYDTAAILFLDVVEKYAGTPAAAEAQYYLAESLFQKRDYLSARRFFERVVEGGSMQRRYQEAIERLIELSIYTGDSSKVDGYLAQLDALPRTSLRPSVPYVRGKYYYFQKRYDESAQVLSAIGKENEYWPQSQYLLGAIQVAKQQLPQAITIYVALSKFEHKTPQHERVVELTQMALGRLNYEVGQVADATLAYSKINEGSDLYADALYEQAWVAIKEKEYKKAYRALDLLLTIRPEGPLVPEVRLLLGNLHIRQAEWTEATDEFTKTRDEFDSIRREMDQTLQTQGGNTAWFRELVAKNLERFDVSAIMPAAGARFVAKEGDLGKVATVAADVTELRKSVDECTEILGRLDKAMTGAKRINIFPDLADARTRAEGLYNELLEIERRLTQHERKLVAPVANLEQGTLDQLAKERDQLEEQLQTLPRAGDAYQKRIAETRAQFQTQDKRATEIQVLLANLRAERVAIEKYFRDTGQDLNPEAKATFEPQLAEIRAQEEALVKQQDALRVEITDAIDGVGVDDVQMQKEAALRRQLDDKLAAERKVFGQVKDRLDAGDRAKVDQIEQTIARARAARDASREFNGRLDGIVDDRLKNVTVVVAEEKAHVAEHELALGARKLDTSDIGGEVVQASFKSIADRFYNVVVRSEVGILDVAWALKQTKTDENSRLVREKKRELKLLDDEFKEVLKD